MLQTTADHNGSGILAKINNAVKVGKVHMVKGKQC